MRARLSTAPAVATGAGNNNRVIDARCGVRAHRRGFDSVRRRARPRALRRKPLSSDKLLTIGVIEVSAGALEADG